jgi:hypothetical protein
VQKAEEERRKQVDKDVSIDEDNCDDSLQMR